MSRKLDLLFLNALNTKLDTWQLSCWNIFPDLMLGQRIFVQFKMYVVGYTSSLNFYYVFFSGLDEQAKIDKIKELLLSLPRHIIVVMRYLFAFLNQ